MPKHERMVSLLFRHGPGVPAMRAPGRRSVWPERLARTPGHDGKGKACPALWFAPGPHQYFRINATIRPCTFTLSGGKMRVSYRSLHGSRAIELPFRRRRFKVTSLSSTSATTI
jgi:hypothetical protein